MNISVYQELGKEFLAYYPIRIVGCCLFVLLFFINTVRLYKHKKDFHEIELLYELFLIFILVIELYFSGIVGDVYTNNYVKIFLIITGLCFIQHLLHSFLYYFPKKK